MVDEIVQFPIIYFVLLSSDRMINLSGHWRRPASRNQSHLIGVLYDLVLLLVLVAITVRYSIFGGGGPRRWV